MLKIDFIALPNSLKIRRIRRKRGCFTSFIIQDCVECDYWHQLMWFLHGSCCWWCGGVNILLVNVTEIKLVPIVGFPNTSYSMRFLSRSIVVATSRDAAWKNEDYYSIGIEKNNAPILNRLSYMHCCAYYSKMTTKRYCHLRIDEQTIELRIGFQNMVVRLPLTIGTIASAECGGLLFWIRRFTDSFLALLGPHSSVAQRQSVGLITQRSVDRNHAELMLSTSWPSGLRRQI